MCLGEETNTASGTVGLRRSIRRSGKDWQDCGVRGPVRAALGCVERGMCAAEGHAAAAAVGTTEASKAQTKCSWKQKK